MEIDSELLHWPRDTLIEEIKRLRDGIREHRNQKLDDRCWMDDFKLYELLPEGLTVDYVDIRQLPKEEMMRNCDRFTTLRATSLSPEEAIQQYKIQKLSDHKYVAHPTYTGVGCAMCGRDSSAHPIL